MTNSTIKVPVPAVTPAPITPPPVPVSIVDSTKNGINAALVGTTLTITDSGVIPPPPDKIGIGSNVQTMSAAPVRNPAGGAPVGNVGAGAKGVVTAGPETANGFPWWCVKFTSGPTGYVGADNLELSSGPNLPQS
jgi:hypothetical protein